MLYLILNFKETCYLFLYPIYTHKMPAENNTETNENASEKINIEGYNNLQDFIKDGFNTLREAIKNSNGLPQGPDWNFYKTHNDFTKIVEDESKKILVQINALLKTNDTDGNMCNRGLDEKTELIIEANDNILERVATNIDEMNGIRKTGNAPMLIQNVSAELPINGSWNRVDDAKFSVSPSFSTQGKSRNEGSIMRLLTAKNICRPQTFFKDKIDNRNNIPWEPKIKDKPNSLKPLAIFLELTENGEEYSHPYEFELERFVPPQEQLQKESPILPAPLSETPLILVSEPEQIDDLLKSLLQVKEFAVDLEHHSYRTFMGITCLMQISTRTTDYLIDTLALRDKLHVLNEAFTKPSILKVFHGADNDILWLQRDLSIYVVNMFDTYYAAKQLEYSGLSLAYLIQRFCNFLPNKQFQLADWRMRPLPDELKNYAREDTHYLLYIYQMLKNELLQKANGKDNLILSVFNSSTEVCKKRYFKPALTDDSHLDFYRKCKRLFDNRQLYALKELYKWRDEISRREDESTGYVLPNHMLLQIAESLPREMQGILACCNPIPPLVRSNLLELHQIILKAKDQSLVKPILQEDSRARGSTKKISKINVDSVLNCPHDLTKSNEFRDDLPTILQIGTTANLNTMPVNKFEKESLQAKCSVFDTPENSDEDQEAIIKEKIQGLKFLTPIERYKMVKPFIQAEENKINEKEAEETKLKEETVVEVTESSAEAPVGNEDRTDEERIASIRDLFLTLNNQPPFNPDQSLVQMGGTKRKREPSPPIFDQAQEEFRHPANLPISNQHFNPRKRRPGYMAQDAGPSQKKFKANKPNPNQNQKQKNNQQKKSPKNNRQKKSPKNNQQNKPPFNKKLKAKKQPNNYSQHPPNYLEQQHNAGYQNQGPYGGNSRNSGMQQQQQFVAYDYSGVDFRQFQGGAGNFAQPQQFKSNYKFKNKNKPNKQNNKSSTMGKNPVRGKRGRGGRGGRGGRQ